MKVKYIVLSGKKYPAICTLNVLAEIQEHYSTTMEFEREILGLYYLRNENGEYILDDNGNPKMGMKEPSAKAVKVALLSMINEGLKVEAYRRNVPYNPVDEMILMQECNVNYKVLGNFLHAIYAESFRTKKL